MKIETLCFPGRVIVSAEHIETQQTDDLLFAIWFDDRTKKNFLLKANDIAGEWLVQALEQHTPNPWELPPYASRSQTP